MSSSYRDDYIKQTQIQTGEPVLKVCEWNFGLMANNFVIMSQKAKEIQSKSPDII